MEWNGPLALHEVLGHEEGKKFQKKNIWLWAQTDSGQFFDVADAHIRNIYGIYDLRAL